MGWQEWCVAAVGALVAWLLIRKTVCLLRPRSRGGCAACGSTACPLKSLKGDRRGNGKKSGK